MSEDTNKQGTAALRELLDQLESAHNKHCVLADCVMHRQIRDSRAELAALVAAPALPVRDTLEMAAKKCETYCAAVRTAIKVMQNSFGAKYSLEYLSSVDSEIQKIQLLANEIRALAPAEVIRAGEVHDAAIYNEGYDEGHADACKGILKRSQMQMFTNDQLAAHDAQLLEADHVKLLDYLSFHSRDSQAYADAYQKVGEWVCEWTPLAGVTNSPSQNSLPETVVRTASQRQFSEPELAAHDAAIRDPLLDVMREMDSLVQFASKREVESPSNHQEFAREAEERLRRWDAALRSASVKPPTDKLYAESEVAAIRDEALELATLVTGYAGSPMLLARMQEMAKKVLRSASVKPVAPSFGDGTGPESQAPTDREASGTAVAEPIDASRPKPMYEADSNLICVHCGHAESWHFSMNGPVLCDACLSDRPSSVRCGCAEFKGPCPKCGCETVNRGTGLYVCECPASGVKPVAQEPEGK